MLRWIGIFVAAAIIGLVGAGTGLAAAAPNTAQVTVEVKIENAALFWPGRFQTRGTDEFAALKPFRVAIIAGDDTNHALLLPPTTVISQGQNSGSVKFDAPLDCTMSIGVLVIDDSNHTIDSYPVRTASKGQTITVTIKAPLPPSLSFTAAE